MKAEFDRWVLPPAVAAAVFAVIAASPPTEAPREALRVEGAQVGTSGSWLLRAAWEQPESGALRAPSRVRFSRAGQTTTAEGARDAMYAWASMRAGELSGYSAMEVEADGQRAVVEVSAQALAAVPTRVRRDAAMDVAVEGGALITEEPGVVWVRARGATAVRMEPELDGVTVTPPRAEVDACGVARFEVRVEALGAPVRLTAEGSGATASLRLPMRPGGLWTRWTGGVFEVRSAAARGSVFVAGGTRAGVTRWAELAWAPDGDRAVARWTPPSGVEWAVASSVSNFAEATGAAREAFSTEGECVREESSRRWLAAIEPLPMIPEPAVLFDGVARGRSRGVGRRATVRMLGFAGLALSVLAEVALVMGAGLSADPNALRGVTDSARKRAGLLVSVVLTLAVAGLALAVSGLIHASD